MCTECITEWFKFVEQIFQGIFVPMAYKETTGSSLTLAKMLRAEKRKQQAKMHQKKIYRQLLNTKFFEQLWKVVENTKVVHYFDNSKGIFFFRGQNLNSLAANQVQNLSTSRGRHLSVSDWSLWYLGMLQYE